MNVAWRVALAVTLASSLAPLSGKAPRGRKPVTPWSAPHATASALPPAPHATAPWNAASFSVRAWTTGTGLPNGTITAVVEADDGYLWLASSPALLRFDGREFTTIDATQLPPLANRQVRALAPARRGGVWMGTPDGVIFRADGHRVLQALPVPTGIRELTRIIPGAGDEMWVAAANDVRRFRNGEWVSVARPQARLDWFAMAMAPDGVLWVGAERGLFRSAGDHLELVSAFTLPAGQAIRALLVGADGAIWVAASDGLRKFVPATGRTLRVVGSSGFGPLDSLAQAEDGAIWAANGQGVHRLGPMRERGDELECTSDWIDVRPDSSWIPQLLVSRTGAIVARTEGGGLRVITPEPFRVYGGRDGLPDAPVHHVTGDGAGGVWIGAGCAGLTHVAGDGRVTTVRAPDSGLKSDCVRSVLHEADGGTWVGQLGGNLAHIAADGTIRSWGVESGLPYDDVGPLLAARDGRVWVGTGRGILCVVDRARSLTCPALREPLPPDKIWSLEQDEAGALWIGQVGRATRITDQATTVVQAGMPPGPIRAIHGDADGSVWMASFGGGLARWRKGEVARITTRQGLFDNALSTFLTDPRGHVWLLGNTGVLRTHRDVLNAVADGQVPEVEGVVFGPMDGMPEGNGGHPNGVIDDRGLVLLATVSGLAVFDTRDTSAAPLQHVVLDQVTDRDRALPLSSGVLTVAAGGGPVEFKFAAPNAGTPEKVVVRYHLEGRDTEWVPARGGFARYTALAPGRYVFRLAARNAAGAWREPIVAATIEVLPFWWETWWAKSLFAVIAGLALAGIGQWRLAAVKRRNRALAREMVERVRAEELAHRHLLELAHVSRLATAGELTATLTHELGQPLTAIGATAEASRLMLAANADRLELDAALTEIAEQSQRAAQVVRGLRAFLRRDFSEAEALDLNAEIRAVVRLAQSTLQAGGTAVVLDFGSDTLPVRGDRIPLQQVVLNLVLNAVEAIRVAGSAVRIVRIRTSPLRDGGARVTVADSGPGIPQGDRARVFERFHSTSNEGMGIGLAICRSIVEAHGGRIRVRNLRGAGAVFSFTVPARPTPATATSPHPPEPRSEGAPTRP